jgi:mannose-6-phosphate isomerase
MESKIIDKPWGWEELWAITDQYVGKILYINAGHKLSLQHHQVKEETIRILSGDMLLYVGLSADEALNSQPIRMIEGDTYHIKPGLLHRMVAVEDVKVLEVSTPHLNDVVRHYDEYGRST